MDYWLAETEHDAEPRGWKRIAHPIHGHRFLRYTDTCWYLSTNDYGSWVKDEVALIKAGNKKSKLGDALAELIEHEFKGKSVALVPMPASSAKSPTFKALFAACRRACELATNENTTCKALPLLKTLKEHAPAHVSGKERDVEETYEDFGIDGEYAGELEGIDTVVLVDDVVSSGAHFKAGERHIESVFEGPVYGAFLARTPQGDAYPAIKYWIDKQNERLAQEHPMPQKPGLLARLKALFGL